MVLRFHLLLALRNLDKNVYNKVAMINLGQENWSWIVIVLLTTWDLAWKGFALWKAAKNNQRYWFVALLIVNSVGILPIIYILYLKFFRKKK